METTTVTISAGASIGNVPMDRGTHRDYVRAIDAAIAAARGSILARASGRGAWIGADGLAVSESCVIRLVTLDADRVNAFRSDLAAIAWIFDQDALGFIDAAGADTLVPASAPWSSVAA